MPPLVSPSPCVVCFGVGLPPSCFLALASARIARCGRSWGLWMAGVHLRPFRRLVAPTPSRLPSAHVAVGRVAAFCGLVVPGSYVVVPPPSAGALS